MRWLYTLLFLGIGCAEIFGIGALYGRRPLTTDDYRPLWIEEVTTTVTIADQVAITHVNHLFTNETNNPVEGVFVFPLPEGALDNTRVF